MRPRIQRPTVRGLGASDASAEPLHLELPDGRSVPVASAAFPAELARLHVFAVNYALGSFLVIAERRKRGNRYWIARAYHEGQRASAYLGREFEEADLRRAAAELVDKLGAPEQPARPADPDTVDSIIRDLVARERDPSRRAAAEAIAALVRRGRLAHRA
jgi:hypothetical protein